MEEMIKIDEKREKVASPFFSLRYVLSSLKMEIALLELFPLRVKNRPCCIFGFRRTKICTDRSLLMLEKIELEEGWLRCTRDINIQSGLIVLSGMYNDLFLFFPNDADEQGILLNARVSNHDLNHVLVPSGIIVDEIGMLIYLLE